MKQMAAVKRIGALCGALVLAAGLILSGCEQPSGGGGGGGSEPPVVKKGLSFSKSQATVYAGGQVRLSLSVEGDVSYDDIAVETDGWDASYQSGIVTVSAPAGAKKGDSVTVTAYYLLDKAVKSSCTVTVIEKPADYIPVENITISGTLEGMKVGDSKKLTAAVTPSNATSKDTLFWGSSDPAVATVSQDGTVTVVGYGEAEIFAEVTADLKESNKIPVSVKIDIETLTLEKTKWRSDTWAEGENNTYSIWFTSNTDAVVQGVMVYPNGDTESLVYGSSYQVNKPEQTITIYDFGDLSIKDSFLQAWGPEFRLVPYTEPPKIINPELVKTKWTGEAGTVWFVDDTHFIWDLEGEIITGEFELKNGLIILSENGYWFGYLFVSSEKQLRDGGGHKYTKTEWTPPPEKSALAGTKWQSSWYSESDQTTYNYTIWFIDDNFVCFQMGGNDMYGTYSVSGQSLSMFGLVEAILNKDSISIPEGSIPGIFSSLKFLEAEYTSPVYSFGENPLADTSWTEVMSGNYVSFNEDYTCSWQLGTEQKLTGIYYFTRQEYNDLVKEWVTTINPENTQGWASFDINRGNDGSITSLVGNDGSLFYK